MMFTALTIFNIMGITITVIKLLLLLKEYLVAPKMAIYILLSITSLTLLLLLQFYRVMDNEKWPIALVHVLLWGKMLYWTWAQKYSSLKK